MDCLAMTHGWTKTADRQPPEGIVVETIDSGGHVQRLVRDGNLYFFSDYSMYVYYVPTAWRPIGSSQ